MAPGSGGRSPLILQTGIGLESLTLMRCVSFWAGLVLSWAWSEFVWVLPGLRVGVWLLPALPQLCVLHIEGASADEMRFVTCCYPVILCGPLPVLPPPPPH